METTETAVDEAVDILHFVLSAAVGALATFLIGVICWAVIRMIAKRSEAVRILKKRVRTPFLLLFPILGTWFGIKFAREELPGDEVWTKPIHHASLILTIACVGWLCYTAANTIHDVAQARSEKNASRRLTTQAQMISRILQAVIVILTIVSIVLTFPEARVLMGSLLASAGVISLVAGLAAQDSLSNTFAGLQLTFTDAIRVGDQLSVDGLNGTVEEITLTYVVLRVWDDRRIILPSTTFTKNKFENWTRVHAKLLGTVELKLDWRAPVNLIRQEVDRLLTHTDLWDKRTINVQVTDSNEQWIIVRVVVSADNSGKLWDLKCYLRENLVQWIIQNAPYALARQRYQQEEITEIHHDRSDEEIVKLAQELVALENTGETKIPEGATETPPAPAKTAQEARVQASKKRAAKVRRKRLKDRAKELRTTTSGKDELNKPQASHAHTPGEHATLVMSQTEVGKLTADLHSASTHGLYSGSEDAEERQKLTLGPGEEAFKHREESTVMRAIRDGEMTIQEALERTTEYPELQQKIKDSFTEKRKS